MRGYFFSYLSILIIVIVNYINTFGDTKVEFLGYRAALFVSLEI